MYLFFLFLFLFVITTRIPTKPYKTEWLLVVLVFALTVEEIRQVIMVENLLESKIFHICCD